MAGINRAHTGQSPITAVARGQAYALLDAYNPVGSTAHVKFATSKTSRWETDSRRCHINWVILDRGWEGEFCRVAERHPKVRAYVKNHNLGLEVPYRYGSEMRRHLPDFIVLIDDGHGEGHLLHLIVEIKGYRKEDAKEKKATVETMWVPGVNHHKRYGRWAFAQFTDVYMIEPDFAAKFEGEFDKMVASATNWYQERMNTPISLIRHIPDHFVDVNKMVVPATLRPGTPASAIRLSSAETNTRR